MPTLSPTGRSLRILDIGATKGYPVRDFKAGADLSPQPLSPIAVQIPAIGERG
jgi:hypothetical protein